jgi:Putative serine esterase (DUF676)
MACSWLPFGLLLVSAILVRPGSAISAQLDLVGASRCTNVSCDRIDAIVFVHGIYGNKDTFVNSTTHFDWPAKFPREVGSRELDVYQLNYDNAMAGWAHGQNPNFDDLAKDVLIALKPLRVRNYRTIGFVTHSLGGNVISTYIHSVKTKFGHPQRSQNAFVITLATPVLGSQWADVAHFLKSSLGMKDDFLESLRRDNLYLRMLEEFREQENEKAQRYICRPVNLHAAFEKQYLGPILVVSPDSAALPISKLVASPIVGFPLNHNQMAKPKSQTDNLYKWVFDRIMTEYVRVSTWEAAHESAPTKNKLCELMDFVPESP